VSPLLRDATVADAAALAAVGKASFIETFGHLYKPEDLAAFLRGREQEVWREELASGTIAVRLAELEGQPVGYAKLGPLALPVASEGSAIEVRQFYVLHDWQGSGLARQLMDWVLEQAHRAGIDHIFLSVWSENVRARRFYDRYGFTFVGTYAFMVGNHADEEHILRLDLKEGR
jgi:ribosomal protein S18 acetylase RimI-like enzyme